jgi:hypothetical protein
MRRWLLGGALAVGLLAPLAYAQSVIYTDLSGNECWNAGQSPGGPSSFLCTDVVRNSRQTVAGVVTGSMTFGTGTLAQLRWGGDVIMTAQPLAATTLIAPPNPVPDGAIIGMCNGTASAFATTNIAMTTSISQTMTGTASSLTDLAASTCHRWQFNRATTTWYRTIE